MTLIVKIMTDDGFADDSPYKAHSLLTGVIGVRFLPKGYGEGKPPCAELIFENGEPEYHEIDNNVYVMNESGKTISSWAAPVQVPQKKGTVEVLIGKSRISLLDKPYNGIDLYREMAVGDDRELQIETDDGEGPEWRTVKKSGRYYPGDGQRFREVPE